MSGARITALDFETGDHYSLEQYRTLQQVFCEGIPKEYLLQYFSDEEKQADEHRFIASESELSDFVSGTGIHAVSCIGNQTASEFAATLVQKFVENSAGFLKNGIDYIIYCHTAMEKNIMLSPACRMQYVSGYKHAQPFSVSQMGPVAFFKGLEIALSMLQCAPNATVLMVCADQMIWPEKRYYPQIACYGDGCAMALVQSAAGGGGMQVHAARTGRIPAMASGMAISEFKKSLVSDTTNFLKVFLNRCQYTAADIGLIVPPGINKSWVREINTSIGADDAQLFFDGLDQFGSLSAADPLANIAMANRSERLDRHKPLLLWGVSMNGSIGCALIQLGNNEQ